MPRIKNVGSLSQAPSKRIQKDEIIKCGSDASYFINRYVKITHPERGLVKFDTYPFQDDCLKAFQERRMVIVNKSRQLGLSTICAAYALWMAIFQREKNILIIATKLETAKLFISKVKTMKQSLPDWLVMPKIQAESVRNVVFSNGSQIKAIPTSPDAGRGESLSLLIIDEAAHVEGIDELWLGLRPTLSCLTGNTKVFTDRGIFNIEDFHKNRKIGEYFKINGWSVYGKDGMEPLSHGYVSPESETIKVETKHGYSVEGTLKHPLWTLVPSGGEMKQIQNLKIGNYLRIQIGMGCFGKEDLGQDLAYMLGGYIAEGNFVKRKKKNGDVSWNGIQITNTDNDFRQVFLTKSKATKLEKNFKEKPSEPNKIFCYSTKTTNTLINLGVEPTEKCFNKSTPKSIWTSNKESQCAYLSGLFDGDGSVGSRGIVLNSTSKKLIQETQLLLSNLGFVSNIYHIPAEKVLARERKTGRLLLQGKPVKVLRDSWQLQIPRSQFKKFSDDIGFRIQRKQKTLIELSEKHHQDDFKLFSVPVEIIGATIKEMINRLGKPDHWFRIHGLRIDKWKTSSKNNTGRTITQTWLKRFRKLLIENGFVETAGDQRFFDSVLGSFIWDPVVSLTAGTAKTYDFTVPNTHTFIQNGILGSNTGGSAILLSTPSGVGTLFHKLWIGAQENSNEFFPIELPWTVHPERDQEWFEREKAEIIPAMGEKGVAQELLCSFMSSGDTFLNALAMEKIFAGLKEPIATYGPINAAKKEVWVWEHPKSDHKYLIGADVARGDGSDFSAFHIVDITNDEVVAEYKGKIQPDKFGELLIEMGIRYNMALICAEKNNVGFATAIKLKESKYPNLYYEKFHKNIYMVYSMIDVKDETPGFETGPKNRTEILARLEAVLRNGNLKVYSKRLYEELQTFVWKGNKAQAQKGYHDDLVMSLAIANSLFDAGGTSTYSDDEVAKALLAGMSTSKNVFGPGGTVQNTGGPLPPVMTDGNLRDYTERARQNTAAGSKTHNYNDPFWRQFSWVWKS